MAAKKKSEQAQEEPNGGAARVRKTQVKQTDVPRHSLHEALRVPQALADSYAKSPTKPFNVAAALELSPNSSHFRMLVGASAAYGLTDGSHSSDLISLTDLGRRIVAPTEEGIDQAAMREAALRPRVIRDFLTKYNNSRLPTDTIARNVLEEMGVPCDSTEPTLKLIIRGARDVGLLRELKGHTYVDLDSVTAAATGQMDATYEDTEEVLAPDLPPANPHGEQKSALPSPSSTNDRVFITHGKNSQIVNQLKELLTFGKFVPVVAAENETVSKPVPDKVLDDMRSCYAAIIHVGKEIKVLDQDGKEHTFLNQNVLIEIGAAMALYNRRFILLVERGVTLPSNLQGLYEVRYEGDRLDYDATMKLLRAFNDFKS